MPRSISPTELTHHTGSLIVSATPGGETCPLPMSGPRSGNIRAVESARPRRVGGSPRQDLEDHPNLIWYVQRFLRGESLLRRRSGNPRAVRITSISGPSGILRVTCGSRSAGEDAGQVGPLIGSRPPFRSLPLCVLARCPVWECDEDHLQLGRARHTVPMTLACDVLCEKNGSGPNRTNLSVRSFNLEFSRQIDR